MGMRSWSSNGLKFPCDILKTGKRVQFLWMVCGKLDIRSLLWHIWRMQSYVQMEQIQCRSHSKSIFYIKAIRGAFHSIFRNTFHFLVMVQHSTTILLFLSLNFSAQVHATFSSSPLQWMVFLSPIVHIHNLLQTVYAPPKDHHRVPSHVNQRRSGSKPRDHQFLCKKKAGIAQLFWCLLQRFRPIQECPQASCFNCKMRKFGIASNGTNLIMTLHCFFSNTKKKQQKNSSTHYFEKYRIRRWADFLLWFSK